MIARSIALACLTLLQPLAAPVAQPLADEGPTLRWVWKGERAGVEVLGLSAADLADLAQANSEALARTGPALLTVGVEPSSAALPLRPIAGRLWVDGSTLRFEPRFPSDRSVALVARLDPAHLPHPTQGQVVVARLAAQLSTRVPTTRVSRVDPAGEVLPANLLKFYLTFSGPMSRGEAYRRVRIRDEAGQPLVAPFLEVGEELWNESGTRLTLLLDPGRIKRGLVPHAEDGPVLVAGRSYTLVVDPDWRDAEGCPLVAGWTRSFRAGPVDLTPPDPATWTVRSPAAGGREPLTVAFPEALDRAMLANALVVVDPAGQPLPGAVEVAVDGRGWSLRPLADWRAGAYQIQVNPELEDLVGNSVARPFEVDMVPPAAAASQRPSGPAVVPFTVGARPVGG